MMIRFFAFGRTFCFQIVERGKKRYVRQCPFTLFMPTPKQMAQRFNFSKSAHSLFGKNRSEFLEDMHKNMKGKAPDEEMVEAVKQFPPVHAVSVISHLRKLGYTGTYRDMLRNYVEENILSTTEWKGNTEVAEQMAELMEKMI